LFAVLRRPVFGNPFGEPGTGSAKVVDLLGLVFDVYLNYQLTRFFGRKP